MSARRRSLHKKAPEEVGLQIAPMIDITLLLLFFFMLTDPEGTRGAAHPVHLPESNTPQSAGTETDTRRFDISVDTRGEWFANGRPVNPPELPDLLKNADTLLIRADAKTPSATIQRIASYAAQGGVKTIEYAVNKL